MWITRPLVVNYNAYGYPVSIRCLTYNTEEETEDGTVNFSFATSPLYSLRAENVLGTNKQVSEYQKISIVFPLVLSEDNNVTAKLPIRLADGTYLNEKYCYVAKCADGLMMITCDEQMIPLSKYPELAHIKTIEAMRCDGNNARTITKVTGYIPIKYNRDNRTPSVHPVKLGFDLNYALDYYYDAKKRQMLNRLSLLNSQNNGEGWQNVEIVVDSPQTVKDIVLPLGTLRSKIIFDLTEGTMSIASLADNMLSFRIQTLGKGSENVTVSTLACPKVCGDFSVVLYSVEDITLPEVFVSTDLLVSTNLKSEVFFIAYQLGENIHELFTQSKVADKPYGRYIVSVNAQAKKPSNIQALNILYSEQAIISINTAKACTITYVGDKTYAKALKELKATAQDNEIMEKTISSCTMELDKLGVMTNFICNYPIEVLKLRTDLLIARFIMNLRAPLKNFGFRLYENRYVHIYEKAQQGDARYGVIDCVFLGLDAVPLQTVADSDKHQQAFIQSKGALPPFLDITNALDYYHHYNVPVYLLQIQVQTSRIQHFQGRGILYFSKTLNSVEIYPAMVVDFIAQVGVQSNVSSNVPNKILIQTKINNLKVAPDVKQKLLKYVLSDDKAIMILANYLLPNAPDILPTVVVNGLANYTHIIKTIAEFLYCKDSVTIAMNLLFILRNLFYRH